MLHAKFHAERLEKVQCRKTIIAHDATPKDTRNAHVPCPQAVPALSITGARALHLCGGMQCQQLRPFEPNGLPVAAPELETGHRTPGSTVAQGGAFDQGAGMPREFTGATKQAVP